MDEYVSQELQSQNNKILYQHNYLFLIKHKDLYNGKLNKKQIVNYINKNFILGYEFDKINMTHLMCACIYSQNDSNFELVKLLLNESNIYRLDNTNRTALSYTLKNPGNVKILKLLLDNIEPGINSDLINDAFIYWSKTDYLPDTNIAEILINAGASVNYKNTDDSTVLINIINNRNYQDISHIVKFLLNKGVDIYMKTKVKPYDDIIKGIRWVSKISSVLFETDDLLNDEPEYDLMDHIIERYHRDKNIKNYFTIVQFWIEKITNI
ncbi:ankyrin repeat protein [Acanthamoeba polyphaga moumouvirus]|uniref:Ankyrin repeat protein n=1 Tax=Acanthamoeba polyphaga moumouvirus TaxID=1269028 RepID=L7RCR9_9VIRU|nr:ankyrin repeat protein [Acanthamoeba polyphaga moumouvirus]AGC02419.1 ankyrin repeat protein [Acanthamoeba polyphaga moumouvirus]